MAKHHLTNLVYLSVINERGGLNCATIHCISDLLHYVATANIKHLYGITFKRGSNYFKKNVKQILNGAYSGRVKILTDSERLEIFNKRYKQD